MSDQACYLCPAGANLHAVSNRFECKLDAVQEEKRRERAINAVRETEKANQAVLALKCQQKEQERLVDATIAGTIHLIQLVCNNATATHIRKARTMHSDMSSSPFCSLQTIGRRRPQQRRRELLRWQPRLPPRRRKSTR